MINCSDAQLLPDTAPYLDEVLESTTLLFRLQNPCVTIQRIRCARYRGPKRNRLDMMANIHCVCACKDLGRKKPSLGCHPITRSSNPLVVVEMDTQSSMNLLAELKNLLADKVSAARGDHRRNEPQSVCLSARR